MSSSDSHIRLVGNTPATEVYLIDSRLHLVAGGLRELRRQAPAGIYKARFQLGSAIRDELVDASAGEELTVAEPAPGLQFISPVPLVWTRPAEELLGAGQMPPIPEGEQTVTVTLCSPKPGELVNALSLVPWDGGRSIRLQRAIHPGGASASATVQPGMYVLRLLTAEKEWVARIVPVLPGRVTRLFIELPGHDSPSPRSAFLSGALLTTRGPFSPASEAALLAEVARQALERQHAVFYPADIREALRRDGADPLFALYAAHAWIEGKRRKSPHLKLAQLDVSEEERESLRDVLGFLSNAFGDLPDVAVLGPLCGLPSRPGDVPPLLRQSWRLWKEAALDDESLMPESSRVISLAAWQLNSPQWWAWKAVREDVARSAQARAVRSVFLPSLLPAASRAPSWVQGQTFASAVSQNPEIAASALQLPGPLAMASARALDGAERRRHRVSLQARLDALGDLSRPLCLVSMPSGIRIDPERGIPVDFEFVYENAIEPAALRAGWAPVRFADAGAALSPGALRDRQRLFDVLVADVTFADPAVIAELGHWVARQARSAVVVRAASQHAAVLPGFPRAVEYAADDDAAGEHPALELEARARAGRGAKRGRAREERLVRRELASLCELRGKLRSLRTVNPEPARKALAAAERQVLRRAGAGSALSEAIRTSMLMELFFAYRAAGDVDRMLRLAERMPEALQDTVVIREQRAYALNRAKGSPAEVESRRKRAIALLETVIRDIGPNGETCGLLGSVYKREWKRLDGQGGERAEAALDNAIQWYLRGFEATPADPYPGTNAVTLLLRHGGRMDVDLRERLLPAVELAATRRLRARPGYWDYATLVELAVHKQDRGAAYRYFELALRSPHPQQFVESTIGNLEICRAAFGRMQKDPGWIGALCDQAREGNLRP